MSEQVVQYVAGPVVVAVLAWLANWRMNKAKADAEARKASAEETTAAAALLESQRKDFDVLLGPLKAQVDNLLARVDHLERTNGALISFSRLQQYLLRVHAPEHAPDIPEGLIDVL